MVYNQKTRAYNHIYAIQGFFKPTMRKPNTIRANSYISLSSVVYLAILFSVFSTNILAQTHSSEKRDLAVTQLTSGLDHPWSLAFISENDWLITERSGSLRRIIDGQLQPEPIRGLPKIDATGQGGLLDVALHPEFDSNQWVYFSYTAKQGANYGTEVARGKLIDNELQDVEIIFKALPKVRGGRHFGSRLVFDDRGYLFVSLGDRGDKHLAQQQDKHIGTIVRLHDNGSVPTDNPFVNSVNVLPEIYSYGHRNIQGMAFDKQTKTLWAHEHGPQGGDELNKILPGQNYGWPTITFGANYGTGSKIGEGTKKDGMLQPITYWDPSIAPSGLAVVEGNRYPEWQGNLLVGALKFQLIARLELGLQAEISSVKHEERLLKGQFGRIRDIRQGPDGYIYFITDDDNGAVYRIQ